MVPLDEFTFHRRLAQTPGTALVLFSGPDCGTCRRVERRLPEITESDLALFYVDVQKSTALAREYGVFHLPTLFLFRDGQYHAKLNCEVTRDALQHAIGQALARPAEEEP